MILKNTYVHVTAGIMAVVFIGYFIVMGFTPERAAVGDDIKITDTLDIDQVNRIISEKTQPENSDKIYDFAFELRGGPLEDARQYLPFLDYLKRATGYDFRLHFFGKNQSIIDALGRGDIDFAAIGAVALIKAQEKYNVINLVRGKNKKNKTRYRAYIVARKNSPLKKLSGLKGKRFAFGSKTSTQGHLIPRIMLRKAGLSIDDFSSYIYTGSHINCATAVIKGIADACGMQDTLALTLINNGDLKKLDFSDTYPSSGIAANGDLDQPVIRKVMDALLDFKPLGRDRKPLHNWDKTEMPNGFGVAVSSDYRELHSWLDDLGLLNDKDHKTRRVVP